MLKNNFIIKITKYIFFYIYNKAIIQPLIPHSILKIIFHKIHSRHVDGSQHFFFFLAKGSVTSKRFDFCELLFSSLDFKMLSKNVGI